METADVYNAGVSAVQPRSTVVTPAEVDARKLPFDVLHVVRGYDESCRSPCFRLSYESCERSAERPSAAGTVHHDGLSVKSHIVMFHVDNDSGEIAAMNARSSEIVDENLRGCDHLSIFRRHGIVVARIDETDEPPHRLEDLLANRVHQRIVFHQQGQLGRII